MDISIASILLLDSLTSGAIYALLGLTLVLLFAVTRILYLPQGEFVAFGALTMAMLQAGQLPGVVWFLLSMAGLVALLDVWAGLRARARPAQILLRLIQTILFPLCISVLTIWWVPREPSLLVQVLLTLALITPFGPLIYRLAFQSLADASVLVLLIVSVGVHFALTGLGLFFFGAEGYRTVSLWDARFSLGGVPLSGQTILIVGSTVVLILLLALFFEHSLRGKALRATAVNRLGARLMGVSTESAGRLSFMGAAFIGALSGILIGPTTTIFYDSGFLIGLKGFIVAVFAGLASYPLTLAGALVVGVIESFSSFWASAYKEVFVFTFILPVLLWRSLREPHVEED